VLLLARSLSGRLRRRSARRAQLRSKKGACFAANQEGWDHRVAALQPSWFYTWGAHLPSCSSDLHSLEFVPMIWGSNNKPGSVADRVERIRRMKDEIGIRALLAFNEPDGADQANMSVDQALELWPMLDGIKELSLGSPAAVAAHKDWMKCFMAGCHSKCHRVDFIAVHWYGGPKAGVFLKWLENVHQLYNRPIWITEFAVADWSAKSHDTNRFTAKQVQQFMREVLPKLDALPYVERYSWFSFKPASKKGHCSALFKADGTTLTPLGEIYASHR